MKTVYLIFFFILDRAYEIKETENKETDPTKLTAAAMEGKLKEKLESTGIAFLCMGIGKFNSNSIVNACKLI